MVIFLEQSVLGFLCRLHCTLLRASLDTVPYSAQTPKLGAEASEDHEFLSGAIFLPRQLLLATIYT